MVHRSIHGVSMGAYLLAIVSRCLLMVFSPFIRGLVTIIAGAESITVIRSAFS